MKKRKSGGLFGDKKMRHEFELLGGASATAACVLIISIFLLTSLDKILIQSNQYASVITAVLVDLVNGDRTSNSLHGLTINPVLVAVAQAKANDMAAKGYFAHISPEGHDPWYWFKLIGYRFDYAGENLAVDFSDSADVERAWMNSPSHRKNLLDPHFTEIGIATMVGFFQGHPTIFVVQMFGAPSRVKTAATIQTATPSDPTALAIAVAKPSVPSRVLGETTAEVGAVSTVSFWSHLFAAPKSAVHIMYYLLALLVIFALALDTGFQIHWHHRRKAATAGFMLALVALVFIVTDIYLFPSPTVPEGGGMTASAAASL
ncbi:MAG: CAP domain-containing protein [bacterium]|nr:CAP domain-containing protein [bacterium]